MSKNERQFAKIHNNFFYDNAIRENKNWRNSLLIYFLFTSRKNMNNDIYISYKEISDVLQFNKNIYRSKPIILDSLKILRDAKLIDFDNSILEEGNNKIIKFKWVEQFPSFGGIGWTKFYADDFEIHSKVGNIPYLVMWILRMYTNNETKTSFISMTDITSILECDRNKVQNSINLFRKYGLFKVISGRIYYNESLDKNIKRNNEYRYSGDISGILHADNNCINEILFPKRNIDAKI